MVSDVHFRIATSADVEAVADVYLASRKAFVRYAPLVHSDALVREWIRLYLIPTGRVTVAERNGEILGLLALSHDEFTGWIDQLYLRPDMTGHGIGGQLVERAKAELGSPICLYTFQANHAAIRFYERHGFRPIRYGDGSDNEEKAPDVLMEWREPLSV